MEDTGRIATTIGAVIAVLLQIIVAPNIALFSAMPNFILVYVLVVAILRPQQCGYVMPFVLGLLFDLMGTGVVGAMAFLCVLATFLSSRAFLVLQNDTLFMPLATLMISSLAVEMLYGAFLLSNGMDVSALDAFVYRGLPCALYDCVVGLIAYPIAAHFFAGSSKQQRLNITQIR